MNKTEIEKLDVNEKIVRIMNVAGNIIFAGLWICGVGLMINASKWISEAKISEELLLDFFFLLLGAFVTITTGMYLEHEFRRWQRSRPWCH